MATDPDSHGGPPVMPTDTSEHRSPQVSLPPLSKPDLPLDQTHPLFNVDSGSKKSTTSPQIQRPLDATNLSADKHYSATAVPLVIASPSSPSSRNQPTVISRTQEAISAPNTSKDTDSRTTPTAHTATANASNGYRPLNVKDALSYLDQVKMMFSESPEVYNQFLDIMKDFKSQAIDTPGVIERVSTLFRGHPSLISGFNTFLPPGYHIECSIDEHARDIIKVTTPSGTTSTVSGEPLNIPSEERRPHSPRYRTHQHQDRPTEGYESDSRTEPVEGGPLPSLNGPYYHQHQPYAQQQHQQQPKHHQHHHYHQQQQQQQQQPSHLLDQNTHVHTNNTTEDGDRRPPVEFNHAINYVNKIKNHFASEPDIYKQFLEILQTYQKEQKPIEEVYAQVTILFNGQVDLLSEFKQFLPDVSNNQPSEQKAYLNYGRHGFKEMSSLDTGHAKKKRPTSIQTKGTKRSKLHHPMSIGISDVRSGASFDENVQPIIAPDEVEFFERVKKHIGSKATYNGFLKLLNLFSQQMIDQNTLVDRVEHFIGGNKQLFDKFNILVGFDGQDQVVENIPAKTEKLDLSQCKGFGPSYRLVPKSWLAQSCSGRDELCWQVLNDKYVSHPTWASEDSGFIASKKNQFEEALHHVEDERYDYDMNIEANLNTIALMEPIAQRISTMTDAEKTEYKLPTGLGGPSKTIYKRIIKKIYDEEQGAEIVTMLHNSPVHTVPVVLKRLKQKDEEWKRSQRDWNKIWREIEAKNYYKALDYQGITFKGNEKKAMSTKTLISEIEALHLEQMQELDGQARGFASETDAQLQYSLQDQQLFNDASRLWLSFVARQTIYSAEDCDALRNVYKLFMSSLFTGNNGFEAMSDYEEQGSDSDNETGNRGRPRKAPTDRSQDQSKHQEVSDVTPMDITPETTERQHTADSTHKLANFFGHNVFYCFLRLYQMVYARLGLFKTLNAHYMSDPEKAKITNKAALDLDASGKRFNGVEIDFSQGYYHAMFRLFEKFFDGDMDQQTYEESLRYIFGTKSYIMSTIDRLLLSMTRQLHLMATDPRAQQLMNMMKKYSERESYGPDVLSTYRLEAEDVIGPDENVYQLNFDHESRLLSMRLLDRDDKLFDPKSKEAYEEYMESYTDWSSNTRGIPQNKLTSSFMKRNLRQDVSADDMQVHSGMQYKICSNMYHLFYVIGGEDVFVRKQRRVRSKPTKTATSSRKWVSWLDSKRQE